VRQIFSAPQRFTQANVREIWTAQGRQNAAVTGEKQCLVYAAKGFMIATMDKPWYRKLFRRSDINSIKTTQAKADGGNAEAQFSLGFRFANGEGTAVDFTKAAHWYLKAADQNHALAQFNLGVMFAGGQGVERDDAAAMMWTQKAAQQGDAGAQHSLGLTLRRASFNGLSADAAESNIEAYKWFRLAAAQGYKDSEAAFETISFGLTRSEVAAGDHRAAMFVASHANPLPA
jgi:TPR repeat protein